jgi:hypothetical protein
MDFCTEMIVFLFGGPDSGQEIRKRRDLQGRLTCANLAKHLFARLPVAYGEIFSIQLELGWLILRKLWYAPGIEPGLKIENLRAWILPLELPLCN